MDIEAAVRWEVENGLWENLAVGGDDDQAGRELLEKADVVAEALRLVDGEVALGGLGLDRRGVGDELAAFGAVGLGDHGDHIDAGCVVECGEGGAGEVCCSHENNAQRLGHGSEVGLRLQVSQNLQRVPEY